MKNYKGNMLLIELVIVILFFSLSQVVIVQVFADAQRRTVNTASTNKILVQAENTAERLASEKKPEEALTVMGFVQDGDTYVYTEIEGVELHANIRRFTQPSGELVTVDLVATQGDVEIFTIPSVQYFASEVLQNGE